MNYVLNVGDLIHQTHLIEKKLKNLKKTLDKDESGV
jgi:hypothetical protein